MHKQTHQYSYIYFIFLIFIGIIGVCIYMGINGKYTPISIFTNIKGLITYQQSYSNNGTEKSIHIESISSKRYYYTIRKEIEKQLNIDTGTDMEIFAHIHELGDYFIFTIDNKNIFLPSSSFFFDRKNNNTHSSIKISSSSNEPNELKKLIALTFDDGPSGKYTHQLLDTLKKENIHATFYVLGTRAEEFPEIIQREYNEGHEIGNHGYSHTILTKLSERNLQEEIYLTDKSIFNAIGIYPKTLRPPYGTINEKILRTLDMSAVLWSIDTIDWKTHNISHNIKSIENVKDGDIIIMHDIHETSVASIPTIIKILKEKGFEFVTVSELLGLNNQSKNLNKTCTKKGSCK